MGDGTLAWIILCLALIGVLVFVLILWRRSLVTLRREVGYLAAEKPLSRDVKGSKVVREIHQDLWAIANRREAVARKVAEEDFSLRAILSRMAEGVLIADRDLRILLTNRRLHEMFLLPRSPQDRTVMETFRNHELHEVIRHTLESGEPQFAELSVEVKDGEQFQQRHFQISSASVGMPDRGSSRGALVIFHDVTRIRSLEAVRKEFVANVSHELRTPLSIITGYLETLIEGATDEESSQRFLQTMHKHAHRLNLLIEDLLVLSQLESRRPGLHFEQVDLVQCVDRVVEQLDSRIRTLQATVSVDADKWLPRIEADSVRLEQVVFNLLDNGLKHGGKPGITIRIQLRATQDCAIIRIQDNGPGIPLSDQPHIFERFYRVHKDRSRDAGGTGLGLSIVKHIVQAHGGTVTLESTPGAGATFAVTLPLRQS
jgi:two-component system phosphate regulon sensor histidine kinase PhoR